VGIELVAKASFIQAREAIVFGSCSSFLASRNARCPVFFKCGAVAL
jgi:hypothetical protein